MTQLITIPSEHIYCLRHTNFTFLIFVSNITSVFGTTFQAIGLPSNISCVLTCAQLYFQPYLSSLPTPTCKREKVTHLQQ